MVARRPPTGGLPLQAGRSDGQWMGVRMGQIYRAPRGGAAHTASRTPDSQQVSSIMEYHWKPIPNQIRANGSLFVYLLCQHIKGAFLWLRTMVPANLFFLVLLFISCDNASSPFHSFCSFSLLC